MYSQVKKHMERAYELMRQMEVSGDNVKRLAVSELELEEAFRALRKIEEKKAETAACSESSTTDNNPAQEVTANG